jgi:hypothetical protein
VEMGISKEYTMMIQFSDFYDDIDFMIALFFNGMLNNAEIYEIANCLNNKTFDDVLAKIIANGTDANNKKLFNNYLEVFGINILDSRKAIVAKVFYYILYDRLDFYEGIRFVAYRVSKHEDTKTYIGDDVGIERILGNFYLIDDGDLSNEKDIEIAIEFIIMYMKQYVNDHLMSFIMDSNISQDNEKTVIKTEIEKKVKIKALAKGIQGRNYWVEALKSQKRQTAHNETVEKCFSTS